eukprot:gene3989-4364_t
MTHDAATGELVEKRDAIVADWSKTQSVGLVDQLNCGARAFDYRPVLGKDNVIYAQHGGVTIHKPMKSSLLEIIQWTLAHPTELVLLYLSHWDNDNGVTQEAVQALLTDLHVPSVTNCADLSMNYSTALSLSRRSTLGGHLLAVFDCMDENFDSSITCYGRRFVCYDSWPKNTKEKPFQAMQNYLHDTTASDPTSQSVNLWMTQGHWQSSVLSVGLGALHRSTLLLDEERSQINAFLAQAIRNGSYPYMNILEVDNVCDGGNDLLAALQSVYLN